MARQNTIQLLLLNASENDSETIISLFRDAGRVARTTRIDSAENLHELLTEKHYDLFIADDNNDELKPEQCLEEILKRQLDLPTILLRDSETNFAELAEKQVVDILSPSDTQKLVFAALREVNQVALRRELNTTREQLSESEKRCEQLLEHADEALVYISDGMLIQPNDAFAALFEYSDKDDLDCLPIIDLLAASAHEQFKVELKQITSGEKTELNTLTTGRKESGDEFPISIAMQMSAIDGEDCIQLKIDAGHTASSGASDNENTGSSHNYTALTSQLGNRFNTPGKPFSLLMIAIDDFQNLRVRLGIDGWQHALSAITEFTASQFSDGFITSINDDVVAVIHPHNSDKTLSDAEGFCKTFAEHVFEEEGQSLICTASIAVLDATIYDTDTIDMMISHGFQTIIDLRDNAKPEGIGNRVQLSTMKRPRAKASGENANLDEAIEHALEDNLFFLLFQPIISLRGAGGDQYECLLQAQDGDEKESALQLLEQLEENCGTTRLDRWKILEGTKQLAEHRNNGSDSGLFINLSVNSLLDDSLASWLGVALKAAHLPPEKLTFQFKEADVNENTTAAKSLFDSLRDIGCQISLSKFGLANDPVQTLRHAMPNFVKIDGSYTRQLEDQSADQQVIRALVNSITEQQGQAIISEVENASVLAVLWQIGADLIQGSYLQPPTVEMNYEFTDIA